MLFLTFGTLGAVAWRAEGVSLLGPADWSAVRFTLTQAGLSALISVALAIPLARALARRNFPGRSILIAVLGAPFILPVIVAVLGVLAVYGRNGLISNVLVMVGLPPINIYGLPGVVLAHVFFNMPLATRFLLQGWKSIPSERFRLAASLNFSAGEIQRILEWPMLRHAVPGALLVVFLVCTTSFAVALTLGGGPRATTVELAIYQAFRFDFDLSKAALLALIQFAIGGFAALLAFKTAIPAGFGTGHDRPSDLGTPKGKTLLLQDVMVIVLATFFLVAPLLMILLRGAPGIFFLPTIVFEATARSLAVALASAALCLTLTVPLAILAHHLRRFGGIAEAIGYIAIAASPLVVGTGLFILLFPIANPVEFALPITALVNSVMALPFALRAIAPALAQIETDYGQLANSLHLTGRARLRVLILPRLRRPLGFAAGLSAALSMGDLGVIALFADPDGATLPLQIYRLMATYRMQDAAAAALLLVMISMTLFWLFDRGGHLNADT